MCESELVEELLIIQIHLTYLTKTIKIGALLTKSTQEDFKNFFSKALMFLYSCMKTCIGLS